MDKIDVLLHVTTATKHLFANGTFGVLLLLMDSFCVPFQLRWCFTLQWAFTTLEWFDVLMDKFDVTLHVKIAAKNLFADGTWLTFDLCLVPVNALTMDFQL